MPSQYPYRQTIRNEDLGVSKVIRAMSADELDWLVEVQRSTWREQISRKRRRQDAEREREAAKQHAEDLKNQAEEKTKAAKEHLETFRSILSGSLRVNVSMDWEQLLDRSTFHPFRFNHPKPNPSVIRLQLLGPAPTESLIPTPVPEKASVWEVIFPFLRRRRLERDAEAENAFKREKQSARAEFARQLKEYHARENESVQAYNAAVVAYNSKLKKEKEKYIRERNAFLARQESHNSAVLAFRIRYETGSPEAIEQYVQMALERSPYPEPIAGEPAIQFDEASETIITSFLLPNPEDVPNIIEYKYIASRKAIKPIEMKQKEFETFYDDLLHQIALRTMHEVFIADYANRAEACVFNG
jgi:restriction system protein